MHWVSCHLLWIQGILIIKRIHKTSVTMSLSLWHTQDLYYMHCILLMFCTWSFIHDTWVYTSLDQLNRSTFKINLIVVSYWFNHLSLRHILISVYILTNLSHPSKHWMSDRRVDLVHIGYIGPWPILGHMMFKLHPQFGHPTFEQQHSIWTLDWVIILDVMWIFMTSMRFLFNIVFQQGGIWFCIAYSEVV